MADQPLEHIAAPFMPERFLTERLGGSVGSAELQHPVLEVPVVQFGVERARDLLVLDVEARGMELVTGGGGPRLVVIDGQDAEARLIVVFPPQHLGEQAWAAGRPPPATELSQARFARFSRLVFAVAAGESIPFSSEGLLAAMRRLPLIVVPVATPRPGAPPGAGDAGHLPIPGASARSSAEGILAGATDLARAGGVSVDTLLARSTALRSLRVRLARHAASDLRAVEGVAVRAADFLEELAHVVPLPHPVSTPPAVRAPRSDETAIEAPWRLIISPSVEGGFTHADLPVGPADPADPLEAVAARERIELWHSRLGVRKTQAMADGTRLVSIDERVDRQRVVRAVWARERERSDPPESPSTDSDPFLSSLTPHDRWQLVRQSSETITEPHHDIVPEPVDVKGLSLSSLGAWLDLHGQWDAERYAAHRGEAHGAGAIKSWDHIAPMGRDQFVQVVLAGFLYPLGHAAVLVVQTERQIPAGTDPVARLFHRQFLVVAEPERSHDIHDLPFRRVRFLTLVTPELRAPTPPTEEGFWPTLLDGEGVVFSVETLDHDGQHARLRMPLLFLDAAAVLAPEADIKDIAKLYREHASAKVALDGQRIAFAPSLRSGDTSAEVRTLRLDATLEGHSGVDGRRLQPRMRAAEIVPATSRLLTPVPETFHVNYHQKYVNGGFSAPGVSNAADLFLQVVDAEQVTHEIIPLATRLPRVSFGSTERSGGFVDPAQQIAGLTRKLGTVGDLTGALTGEFEPAKLLGDALPKLFGLFKLTDLLPEPLKLDHAPKFITEALGPIQGLLADLDALKTALNSAATQAKSLGDNAKAQAQSLEEQAAAFALAVPKLNAELTTRLAEIAGGKPVDLEQAKTTLTELLGKFTNPVKTLGPLVATLPLSPLAKSELDRLLRRVQPYLAEAGRVTEAVTQVIAFIHHLDPAHLEVRAKLDWAVQLGQFPRTGKPIFEKPTDPLRISVESRAGVKSGASFDAAAELTKFTLTLVPPVPLMRMRFERLAFRAGSASKTDVDVVFGGIEFIGVLGFVETLKHLIPLDGFSDPPFLDVSPQGVRAGFTLGLPNVAVGVFALQNISLGADCNVPFLGKSVSVGFHFCTRERPFALTVAFIGGGGFLGLRISPQGLELLELALEAGARLAVDFGVASGCVEIMLGIYMRLEGKAGTLTGYLRIRGEVEVLGLISASIELSMELVYEPHTGKMVGRATITVSVHVFMFSTSVQISTERRFAGSNGDPTFAEMMAVEVTDAAPYVSSPRWDDYCDAFA